MSLRAAATAGVLCFSPVSLFAQVPPFVEYDRQIHPILAAKCLPCHSQEKRSGGLSLAAYSDVLEGGRSGAAIRPGGSASSLIVERILGDAPPRMPLGAPALGDAEIAVIRAWIDQGARATPTSAAAKPKWEAQLILQPSPIPQQVWRDWNAPLDRFVAAYLVNNGSAAPPPVISDALFARRVYLDIWGLLPSPDELHAFLGDRSPDKRRKLVAKLLAENRNYAENWISFWNDLLRNDEGVNYYSETASRKSITSWLLSSLESNLSYDRFVTKLLDPASPGDPDGFLVGVNWRGVVSASQSPALQAAQNTAQIFLGVNLKCNSCHDSFINKWKLKDAYSLASYFSSEERLQLYRCDIAQRQFATPAFLFPELNRAPTSSSLADRRATVVAIFTDPRNGRLPRTLVNRIWQRLFGHGIVENVDEMDGEPWSPELLDWLANDFADHHYDMKHLISTIVSSQAYQMHAVPRKGDPERPYIFRGPEVRRVTAEQFADAIGSITGDWHVYQPSVSGGNGIYTREWRVAASSLTRALGRPIRDQVYSTRDTQATTLQALELVNGQSLTHWLSRGARKMLGELPPEPPSIFDRPADGRNLSGPLDVDVAGAKKLWLLVQDTGSYSPERVEAIWARTELVGPSGITPLSSIKPLDESGLRPRIGTAALNELNDAGVRVKTPSVLVYDVNGKGYTRLRGMVGLENREITSEINPKIRFLVFGQQPNMERLTPVAPETPLPAEPTPKTAPEIVERVFWYALGRAPSAGERADAEQALKDSGHSSNPSADGLADLLWAVMMKPEFQLIY